MSSKKKTMKNKSRKLSHVRTSKRGRDFRSKSKQHYSKIKNINRTLKKNFTKLRKKSPNQLKYEELLENYNKWMIQLLRYKSSKQAVISSISNAKHFKSKAAKEASKGNYMKAVYYYIFALTLLRTLTVADTTKLTEDYDTEIAWYPDVTNQVERHNKPRSRRMTRKYLNIKKKSNKAKKRKKTRKL
tara:strand:+ start:133 stop:693 length:561 start_codon:yes stop_codon:yes gene_type:complete